MKTIEEAAKEFAKKQAIIEHTFIDEGAKRTAEHACYKAAIQMAEFAQRWIPIDEELPENNKMLLRPYEDKFTPRQTIKILAKTDCGTITDNSRLKMQTGDKDWVWFMNYEGETVTHWRPINIE